MSGTIVVGTDFSNEAEHALHMAAQLGKALSRQLQIVHVHSPSTYLLPPPLDIVTLPESGQELASAQDRLEQLRVEVEQTLAGTATLLLVGDAATTLVAHAREQEAFLLVVGSRGATGLAHILLGSVAERVSAMPPVRSWWCPRTAGSVQR